VPVPEVPETTGAYIFTVFTPTITSEVPLWRFGTTEMTTHRLVDHSDSTTIFLRPVGHPSLRTYFSMGAAAGAESVTLHPDAPDIAEVLVYPTLLSPGQRQLTESYLALKHGLTLDQQRPVNYLAPAPDGESYPIWTATAAPEFRHRIIGLARDDASDLLHNKGHSVLAPELLQLHWTETPDSTAYLVIADDDGPTARATELDANGLLRLQRRWRVETTGAVPSTTVSIDPKRLFAQVKAGERLVLISDNIIVEPALAGERLAFPLPAGTEYFQLALAGTSSPPATRLGELSLSPNPVQAGQSTQLRAILAEAAAVTLSVYDLSGRLLEERFLPAATHHLTEVSFPAPGAYTLHLRARHKNATPSTITLLVQ
ncbi:MAG: hypothetical protein AAFZ52_03245, partial [Bacteroidota bacterium]